MRIISQNGAGQSLLLTPSSPQKKTTNVLELNELTLMRFNSIVPVFSVSSFLNISVVTMRRQTRINRGTNKKVFPFPVFQDQNLFPYSEMYDNGLYPKPERAALKSLNAHAQK